MLSDSCGYIALDHTSALSGRIIVAFRGTYSIASTIADLTTIPQEYVPYPSDPKDPDNPPDEHKKRGAKWWDWIHGIKSTPQSCMGTQEIGHGHASVLGQEQREVCQYLMSEEGAGYEAEAKSRKEERWATYDEKKQPECENCTVHSGFLQSWLNTREVVLKHVIMAKKMYSDYTIHLVGHSLGGAVAALAGLELETKGYSPIVTTFGEPRIGNSHLRDYLDTMFSLEKPDDKQRYRRVTHIDDPVPLLPLTEWGYRMHAGEVYIGKKHLPPSVETLRICQGDEDTSCIAGAEPHLKSAGSKFSMYDDWDVLHPNIDANGERMPGFEKSVMLNDEVRVAKEEIGGSRSKWGLPARMKMWQLFFAHRDYFWRLGLCVPGGDPRGWLGRPPTYHGAEKSREERENDEL